MASWKELYSKEMENLEKTDKVSPLKKKLWQYTKTDTRRTEKMKAMVRYRLN